jgi:hypothetical protein
MTSAIIDETLGVLNYILKRDGVVPHGPSYTVHLEVDYKVPVPAGTTVVCVAGDPSSPSCAVFFWSLGSEFRQSCVFA